MNKVRQTSIESYKAIKEELPERQKLVYTIIKVKKKASNRVISEALGLPINSITPRVNELVKKGLITTRDKALDQVTNRTVHLWELTR